MHTSWIILSTITGDDMKFLRSLIYSIWSSFLPSITYLDNLPVVPVSGKNLARATSKLHRSHCRCLGILPKNVLKHRYCLGKKKNFSNWICYHSACEGPQQLLEYLERMLTTVCSPYILKIYHCTSPQFSSCSCRGLLRVKRSHPQA